MPFDNIPISYTTWKTTLYCFGDLPATKSWTELPGIQAFGLVRSCEIQRASSSDKVKNPLGIKHPQGQSFHSEKKGRRSTNWHEPMSSRCDCPTYISTSGRSKRAVISACIFWSQMHNRRMHTRIQSVKCSRQTQDTSSKLPTPGSMIIDATHGPITAYRNCLKE